MLKVVLIGMLSLLLLCVIPLMGSAHHSAGHLHHDASSACATCMGSIDLHVLIFLLTFLGLTTLMHPELPALVASRSPFHPPRLRS